MNSYAKIPTNRIDNKYLIKQFALLKNKYK